MPVTATTIFLPIVESQYSFSQRPRAASGTGRSLFLGGTSAPGSAAGGARCLAQRPAGPFRRGHTAQPALPADRHQRPPAAQVLIGEQALEGGGPRHAGGALVGL